MLCDVFSVRLVYSSFALFTWMNFVYNFFFVYVLGYIKISVKPHSPTFVLTLARLLPFVAVLLFRIYNSLLYFRFFFYFLSLCFFWAFFALLRVFCLDCNFRIHIFLDSIFFGDFRRIIQTDSQRNYRFSLVFVTRLVWMFFIIIILHRKQSTIDILNSVNKKDEEKTLLGNFVCVFRFPFFWWSAAQHRILH